MVKWSAEAKVGSVTLVALALLAYMIIRLGDISFHEKGYAMQAVFSQVNGLKPGNIVRYAGVDVGEVKRVEVQTDGVHAFLQLRQGTHVPQGSKFYIGSDGLLGEKFINIVPPPLINGDLPPNAIVRGEELQGLDQLIASADKVLAEVHSLVRSLNDVIGDDKTKAAMKETISNARDLTANLNAMSVVLARMAVNHEGDVGTIVANLRDMSGSLKEVAGRVDRMAMQFDNDGKTVRDLQETIQNIKSTSQRVEKMAASLEGVVTDPETAQNLKETLRNARAASEKADRLLGKVESIKVSAGTEMLYDTSAKQYSANADIRVQTAPDSFAVIGASHIGDGTRTNLQMGRGNDAFATRVGVVEGKAGIGVDGQINNQWKLAVDAYDPNDVRVKLRTQYQVAPNTFLVGQTDGVNKSGDERSNYIGIRQNF